MIRKTIPKLEKPRNSRMDLDKVYYWTDTIKDWNKLLTQDKYKKLILNEWEELTEKNLITVYGFVIMPNHLHVLWEMKKKNGKEMPYASFNKATGHKIIKDLKENHPRVLPYFKVEEKERQYRVWQADPLAVFMDNKTKFEQKLDYIHNNPLQDRWNLAEAPELYTWSSANFYNTGSNEFRFITHYNERFG